nr:arylesterase [uncultured Caldimonas sp.]
MSPLGARNAAPPKILVVGDSLSAEYGIRRGSGWVALLEQKLAQEKLGAAVVNASISGDTTSGGRSRLPALLKRHQPTHVVIELGGNDALRGLPLKMTQDNLTRMVSDAQASGAKVLIVGMQMPPNYGRAYAEDFNALFPRVAQAKKAQLVPFLLKGVADVPQAAQLFQPDRIHPNEQAQATMLNNVWPVLRAMLDAR